VFVRPIEVNGTNLGWRIGPTFYNSGNTPASGVRTWVNYFSPKEGCDLPVGFSFPDGKRINTIQGLLAPHVAINGRGQDFSIEDLEILQTHTRHFYIYGTVRYSDIFSRPENHITQYCWEISAIQGNVRQNPGSVNVVFSVCAEHNCADNSCRPQEFADGPPEPCPPGPK
jgi:hypothetical protein